jgi:hypothetical protein
MVSRRGEDDLCANLVGKDFAVVCRVSVAIGSRQLTSNYVVRELLSRLRPLKKSNSSITPQRLRMGRHLDGMSVSRTSGWRMRHGGLFENGRIPRDGSRYLRSHSPDNKRRRLVLIGPRLNSLQILCRNLPAREQRTVHDSAETGAGPRSDVPSNQTRKSHSTPQRY